MMMSQKSGACGVAVVIPCYNARAWIGEAVESVLGQDLPELDIVVVDDGSSDGSGRFVRDTYPTVRVIEAPHGGASRARNMGTRRTTAPFIQYLDADDALAPGKLRAQLHALTSTNADVAYGDWCELRPGDAGGFEPGACSSRRLPAEPEIALFTDFWCPPAAYLFRRGIVERVGAWNESLPIIQDARFALDCALHGGRFVHASGLSAYYRRQAGERSLSRRDRSAFVRDCLQNAREVEAWWLAHGGLTDVRAQALIKVYGQVARGSYGRDQASFEAAYAALERLAPGYVPSHPWHLAVASRVFGYRRAEGAAWGYRHAKRVLRGGVGELTRLV